MCMFRCFYYCSSACPTTPTRATKWRTRSELIVDAITFSNPDFQLVLQLARQNPVPGEWEPLIPEDVKELQPTNFSGFRLITDTRVLDARAWQPNSEHNRIVSYRRMLVRRVSDALDSEDRPSRDINRFRIQQFNPAGEVSARSSNKGLAGVLRRAPTVGPNSEKGFMYEAEFDLSSVPSGEDLISVSRS